MAKSKKQRKHSKPQGHPARAAAAEDPLLAKVQRVMGLSVELVRDLKEAGFDSGSEEMTFAMAASVGWMSVSAMMEGAPTPYELRGWERTDGSVRGRTWRAPADAPAELVAPPEPPAQASVEAMQNFMIATYSQPAS